MKLDVLYKRKVRQSGGYRWTAVFATPLGTKVVRIKDRYYRLAVGAKSIRGFTI